MTPMQRMRDAFKSFEKLINIKPVGLNHVEPKYIGYYNWRDDSQEYTKGVESDFIKLYDLNNQKSFGVAFHYKNRNNNTQLEIQDVEVSVTFKTNDIIDSVKLPFNSFSKEFNSIVKELKTSNIKPKLIEKVIKDRFINNNKLKDAFHNQFTETLNQYEEKIKKTQKEIKSLKKIKKEIKSEIKENTDQYNNELSKLTEFQKVKKLDEELKKAKKALSKKEGKLRGQFKLDDLSNKQEEISNEISKTCYTIKLGLERELERKSKKVRFKLAEKLNSKFKLDLNIK